MKRTSKYKPMAYSCQGIYLEITLEGVMWLTLTYFVRHIMFFSRLIACGPPKISQENLLNNLSHRIAFKAFGVQNS